MGTNELTSRALSFWLTLDPVMTAASLLGIPQVN
jgi:hypothetical protein